ncbi:hypothetical protein BX616_011321, partial [Lobosporangium transversale]
LRHQCKVLSSVHHQFFPWSMPLNPLQADFLRFGQSIDSFNSQDVKTRRTAPLEKPSPFQRSSEN